MNVGGDRTVVGVCDGGHQRERFRVVGAEEDCLRATVGQREIVAERVVADLLPAALNQCRLQAPRYLGGRILGRELFGEFAFAAVEFGHQFGSSGLVWNQGVHPTVWNDVMKGVTKAWGLSEPLVKWPESAIRPLESYPYHQQVPLGPTAAS